MGIRAGSTNATGYKWHCWVNNLKPVMRNDLRFAYSENIMKKHLGLTIVFALLLSVTACTVEKPITATDSDIQYVTVELIQASLPEPPIVVGFDIDDTVLFSSPGFHYGLTNHDGPGSTNLYGDAPLHSPKFWNDMNGKFDKFSLPKKSGGALVKMHLMRGDKIVFITARNSSTQSILPEILAQNFGIPKPDVIFTSQSSKTPFINKMGILVYYGDADSDMTQAQKASARPVRVMRSTLSNNNASAYQPGAFGEEVLIHSAE